MGVVLHFKTGLVDCGSYLCFWQIVILIITTLINLKKIQTLFDALARY